MLTKDALSELRVGDVVEAGSIFPGLTPEPVALQVMDCATDPLCVGFVATYFGVTLGKIAATTKGDKVEWEMLK